ncbi:Ig-like domain-containing protein, partial [Bradyrhizobium retamae]|uniref:Ig-like domain-containing protein n=1 Tax=Bradyrhizobium retamae TaxID=1300035 RepID=UPI000B0D9BF1
MTGIINPALFGMPDATTTGVQAGVTLTAYKGPMNITTAGTVIENVIIDGQLAVKAANVTIRNCIIKSDGWWGIEGENSPNLRVENCDIIGGNLTNSGILGSGTFVGNDISHVSIGIQLTDGASTVSGNYIHDLFYGSADPHYDGVTALGGQNHVVIEHNTIIAPNNNGTAAVFIDNDFGSVNDVIVRDNLMFGDPAYTVHVAQKAGLNGTITNVVIENNYLDRGHYGYIAVQNTNATIRNNVQWDNNTDPTPYPTSSPPPTPTVPSAPTIASFSNDSGVAGDGITNDNTLQLKGTAAASSTVKVFDGTTQIGTTTADSSGAWTYTTAALSDGNHSLKATATTTSGTSSTSSVLAVKIDTVAPTAPTMATPTNNANGGLNLTGTAEANSVVKVFDGTTQIGTATANSSGVWGYTTGALAAGSHSLTAKATDAAGNTGAASAVVTASTGTSAPPATPATPTIASFSNDTGAAGDGITSDNTLQLKGTAAANSTIKIYDGSTQIGTTTASSTGSWDYITSVLTNAKHVLTATATNSSGQTSAKSGAVTVTVDTVAPTAPVLSSNAIVNTNQVKLSGTAEANSKVTVYDGTTVVGTGTTTSTGAWSITTNALSTGTHTLTAKAADAAGNVSAASQSVSSVISGASPAPSPGDQIESAGATSLVESGGKYYLNSSSGSGPSLKYRGADFVDGQDGTWTPIGA